MNHFANRSFQRCLVINGILRFFINKAFQACRNNAKNAQMQSYVVHVSGSSFIQQQKSRLLAAGCRFHCNVQSSHLGSFYKLQILEWNLFINN